jgi:hypothetical protein
MTEAEWLAKPDLYPLDEFIRRQDEKRRLRLVACACVREDWRVAPPGARKAILAGEAYADSLISEHELDPAGEEAESDFTDLSLPPEAREIARRSIWLAHPDAVTVYHQGLWQGIAAGGDGLRQRRAAMIIDIFGNPFRPVSFSSEWRTSTALALARQMYDSRDFSVMPILADALQDAGCDNEDILDHCRGPSPHVRGCWVVALVLGKA